MFKITEIVRLIWLAKNLCFFYTGKPTKNGLAHKQYLKPAIDLQTMILEKLKNRKKITYPALLSLRKSWFPRFITDFQ